MDDDLKPHPPAGSTGQSGREGQTPLAARIREPTEEERAQTDEARPTQLPQPRAEECSLPPVEGAGAPAGNRPARAGARDSPSTGSTGSTGSTARSEDVASHLSNGNGAGPSTSFSTVPVKLAMEALERRDYELLALIAAQAGPTDLSGVDQPGGPCAPGTPINPHGSAPYSNGRNYSGHRSVVGRPESAPDRSSRLVGPDGRPLSAGYRWVGTQPYAQSMDPEEIESIVRRTSEQITDETRKLKQELVDRIAKLETRSAWMEPPTTLAPSSGSQRGLISEFDSVAVLDGQDDPSSEAKPAGDAPLEVPKPTEVSIEDAPEQWAVHRHDSGVTAPGAEGSEATGGPLGEGQASENEKLQYSGSEDHLEHENASQDGQSSRGSGQEEDIPGACYEDEEKDIPTMERLPLDLDASNISGKGKADQSMDTFGTVESQGHIFTSLFTLNTKFEHTEDVQQRDLGQDNGIDDSEKELLRWRAMLYTPKSLGIFPLHHPLRRKAISLTESVWFERFIQLTIAANCVQMAAADPRDTKEDSRAKYLMFVTGSVFWAIFAFESLAKILAMGFVRGKGTYLTDNWNRLDFIIVVTGLLDFMSVTGSSVVVARTFRLLRPLRALRAIGRFKDLRMLVELLLGCIPMLANVFALIAFILFVFGILGVQLFSQGMTGRCYNLDDGLLNQETRNDVCTIFDAGGVGAKSIEGGFRPCPEDEGCLRTYRNPNYDFTSFDNIGSAMLIIFQVMLQEDWTPLMYHVWDATSWWTWIYFVFLNLVGPMFAIQLFLVVVASKYSDAKADQAMRERSAVCLYEVKVGFVSATINSSNITTLDSYCKVQVEDKHKKTRVINNTVAPVWQEYFVFPVSDSTITANIEMYNWHRYDAHKLIGSLVIPVGTLDESQEGTDKWYELIDGNGQSVEGGIRVRTQWRRKDSEEWVELPEVEDDDMYDEDDYEDEERSCLGWFQFYCEVMAYSDILMYTTIFVILFNVIVMAIDRDCNFDLEPEYCRNFKLELERINLFFTSFFTLEMIIKMIGFTPMVYLKETANAFDLIIVATSLSELPLGIDLINCFTTEEDPSICEMQQQGGGFAVLRSFRLVRVLRIGKLVRMFPQIQRQLKVISKTLSTVSSLIGLISLFLLIFAILGMNLFGNLSMTELDAMDVDGVPFFRQGAYVRILRPGDPIMKTAQITLVNQTSNEVRIELWDEKGAEIRVNLIQDVWPSDFKSVAVDLKEVMIVGLSPRDCFDDFWNALLTVFQLLTTSDIGDAMYPALRGSGEWTVIYFILITVIGNFMLFNLFVAIIITGFSENKADILKEEKENAIMLEQDRLRKGASIARGPSMKSRQSIRSSTSLSRGASLTRGLSISSSGHGKSLRNSSSINSAQEKDGTGSLIERFVRWFQAKVLGIEQVTAADIQKLANEGSKKSATASEIGSQMSEQPNWSELPFMRKVIENKYWNWFIIIIILLSCISLVLQRPGISQEEQTVSIQINLACNVIFIIEMLWKVAAYRWKRYIANSWNRLDFFLVIISILDMISDVIKAAVSSADEGNPAFGILGFLKNFRAFRALRPLRILSRAKGLKVVLSTLGRAVGPVLNTVAIALICFFIFGIMSVQVMGGRLMYCSDIHALEQRDCVGIDPVTGESRMWLKRQLQYNWIGEAMLSMFVLASQDNWEMHMYAAIDATQKGKGPIANNEPGTGVFFLAILIVASFFVMQLFVGVFIDTFQTVTQENKALSRKSSLASENSSVTSATGAEAPLFWLRSVVYTVVTTKQFDLIIAAFILANIFTMAADTPKSSDIHTRILGVLEFVFNFVFGTEVIAKLWGMYPKQYFNSRWNKFDFVVVMFSYAGIAVFNLGSEFTAGLNPTMLRILRIVRIFRILRAFRIFKAAQGLQNLVRTLLRSLTAVGNLAALLLLLFFVVGVLCVELFGNLCDDSFSERIPGALDKLDRCVMMDPGKLIDFHATFANLMDALLTLFRISTSDNWSELMMAAVRQPGRRGEESDVAVATELLQRYNSTGDVYHLIRARSYFPNCMTVEEIRGMESLLTCRYPDPDTGACPSTCGTSEIVGYGIFTIFLCCSNFILLNLVMAVLMQELQNAIQSSERKSAHGLNMLMNVSAATSKWLKIAGESEDNTSAVSGDASEAGDPSAAGAADSPLARKRSGSMSPERRARGH